MPQIVHRAFFRKAHLPHSLYPRAAGIAATCLPVFHLGQTQSTCPCYRYGTPGNLDPNPVGPPVQSEQLGIQCQFHRRVSTSPSGQPPRHCKAIRLFIPRGQ